MLKECLKCGAPIKVKPSKYERTKYCSRECASKKITVPCDICGTEITRAQSQILKVAYCSPTCTKEGKSKRFSEMNQELNPTRMTLDVRTKLRMRRLGTGEGKSYEKTFGVHTHRIVAAAKIGRPLAKGEIVHHLDNDIRNNAPDNLEVLASQSEHAKLHKSKHGRKFFTCVPKKNN